MLTPRAMPKPEEMASPLAEPAVADTTLAPVEQGTPPLDLLHNITDRRETPTLPGAAEEVTDWGNERADVTYTKTIAARSQEDALSWLMADAEPEVPADETTMQTAGRWAGNVASDLGTMFSQDMDNVIIGGPLRAFQATMRLADPVAAWLDANVFSSGNIGFTDFSKPGPDGKAREFTLPPIGDALNTPESVSGSMAQAMTQFLTGFALAGGVAGKLGMGAATSVAGRAGQTMGLGMLADFAAFDGHEARLSNFIESFPALKNPVTEYLQAKDEDNEYEGRLKNVLEGMFGNAVMELVFAGVRSVRAARKQKALLGGDTYEEAAQKLAKGGADPAEATVDPNIGKGITDALGDPNGNLVEFRPVDLPVPDDVAARGMAMTATEGEFPGVRGQDPNLGRGGEVAAPEGPRTITADDLKARYTDPDGAFDTARATKEIGDELKAAAQRGDEVYSTVDGNRVRIDLDGDVWRDPNGNQVGVMSPLVGKNGADGFEIVPAGSAGQPPRPPSGGAGEPAGSTGKPFVNWARINTPEDVRSIMGQMASAMQGEIETAQRGVRKNAQTIAAAGNENAWNILMGERKIPLPSAEEQLALRNLWASSGQKLLEVSKKAASGSPEDLFAFRRMMAIHNLVQQQVLGIRTETARALQQWAIPAGTSKETLRQIQDAMRASGGEEVSRALAQRISAIADKPGFETAVEEMVRKGAYAKTVDTVREIWINALLSGPKTHIVNFMSNGLVIAQSVIERAIAGRLGDIISPVDGVKIGEATAMMYGLRESYKEALVNAARTFRTGEMGFGVGKIEGPRVRSISTETYGMRPNTMMGKGVDLIGAIVTTPGRALQAADEFFKTINYRAELYAQALRQADEEIQRGILQQSDLKKRMVELITEAPDTLKLRAQDMAAYNTFTNDPGPLVNRFMKFRDAVPGGWLIAPFVQTPANIFKFTMERTPMAPILNSFRADVLAGGARRDLALARMGLGTIVMSSVLDLAVDGHFTGSGPTGDKNSSQRATLRRSGWQPYSIRVLEGQDENGQPIYRYFAYNRLDPVGSTIALAADLGEYLRNSDGRVDPEVEEIMAAAVLSAASTFMDKSYMFGLSSLIDALHNPDRQGEAFFTRLAASFIPTGVKEVAVAMDPTQRHVTDLVSALKARTPGLSQDLEPRLDFWGRPVKFQSGLGTGYDILSPIYSKSTKNAQPIDREFFELAYFPRHPRDIRIGTLSIPLRNMPDVENRWVELTNGKASDLLAETGDELRGSRRAHVARALQSYGDKTMLEALNELVTENDEYKELDADSKQKALERVVTMYRTAAKVQLLREKPRVLEVAKTIKPREERGIEAPF